ncbi:MAG TPA: recombination protein RecR [Firmicutes bacterium]|nr:recombination protein RecR [Bacillota bacterium]
MKELSAVYELIDAFEKLPGVGTRSAERMAYAVLAMPREDKEAFVKAFQDAEKKVHPCKECGLYSEEDLCEVCANKTRNRQLLCVVANAKDALAIEKMNSYNGLYHVLGGLLSASKGISPEDLSIERLLRRVEENGVKEVIIATNPTLEGETTALFLAKLLEKKGVTTTRLGYGLPMGASLYYADTLTLSKAFEGRKKI